MKKLLIYEFEYIQDLEPVRNELGEIFEYAPQENYLKKDDTKLNKYGSGAFCKFSIDSGWSGISGVYAFFVDEELVYIGQASDFAKRFNMGYGNISPKNCFIGGQSTNCKINKMVLESAKLKKKVSIYFHVTNNYNDVEHKLIVYYKPQYNSAMNKNFDSNTNFEVTNSISQQIPKSTNVSMKFKNPSISEVRKYIQNEIENARAQGKKDIEIRSGIVHKHLNMDSAMPTVCSAMRTLEGDYKYEVIEEPPKGNGSRLVFKYIL